MKKLHIDFERTSKENETKIWKVAKGNTNYFAYKIMEKFKTKSQALKYARAYMRKH